jgi:hypothetical protein
MPFSFAFSSPNPSICCGFAVQSSLAGSEMSRNLAAEVGMAKWSLLIAAAAT